MRCSCSASAHDSPQNAQRPALVRSKGATGTSPHANVLAFLFHSCFIPECIAFCRRCIVQRRLLRGVRSRRGGRGLAGEIQRRLRPVAGRQAGALHVAPGGGCCVLPRHAVLLLLLPVTTALETAFCQGSCVAACGAWRWGTPFGCAPLGFAPFLALRLSALHLVLLSLIVWWYRWLGCAIAARRLVV